MKPPKKTISISAGKQYFLSTIILFIFITFLYLVQDFIGYQTVSLILLLIIFLLPLFSFERGPIILSAVISALAWDYYFIPPHFTMHIDKPEDVMMLFMFFIVAVTNGVLTAQLRTQKNEMTEKERRSNALYNLLKELSAGKDRDDVTKKAIDQVFKVFGFESVIFYSDEHNKLNRNPHPASNYTPDEMEWLTAEVSFRDKIETGQTTNTLQDAEAMYFPLKKNGVVFGVIGVNISDDMKPDSPEIEFLRRFINEIIPFLEKHLSYFTSKA
jgi:two-component system sensor histidine kinase KdpD